jgi:glycosyltransferase involved in cell wall biosynthesis
VTSASLLNVGILHFSAPPIVGGVEAIVGRHAIGLLRRGYRVSLLAGRGASVHSDLKFVPLPRLDSTYPPLLEINKGLRAGVVPPGFADLQRSIESELRPILAGLDVCVVHNALTLHFNLPLTAALHALASEARLCPLVAWCHDLSWTNPLYSAVVHPDDPWMLLKRAAPRTAYTVVSEDRRHDLSRLFGVPPERLAVVPAGIDPAGQLGLGPATARLLADYNLERADPFLLLPVRITRRKNIELAIRIVGQLRGLGLQPRLLVTGPRGPHDSASQQYVEELCALRDKLGLGAEVILLQAEPSPTGRRWKPTDRMMEELYRAADLMLLPSAQEGFGIPVLEAGAVGLPIFCSDIPPFREIAGPDASYFGLEEPPDRIAARLARHTREDSRYRLRKRVLTGFDWDAILDQRVIPLLRQTVSGTNWVGVS